MNEEHIYLDNAATTRVDPEVLAAMEPYFCDQYGNPETLYERGRTVRTAVEAARGTLAEFLGASVPEELYFTAGASESNNWALHAFLLGADKKHLVTSTVEHHAILEPAAYLEKKLGVEVTRLPVDASGLVDPQALRDAIRDDTGLVSIMHANNEIGTLEPVAELAAIARERGVPFHTDACQTVGKIPVDVKELGVDLLSLSAHKFHGPKGVGLLYARKGTRLRPFIHGGGQERGRRAGTTNAAAIIGMAKAAERAAARLDTEPQREFDLVERLWEGISASVSSIRRNGHPDKRIPNILNVCIEGGEGEAYLMYLDMLCGVEASSGSACTTGSLEPSHVLLAIGLPAEIAHGSLRMSLSHETTAEQVEQVIEAVPKVVDRVRAMSPTWKG